MGSVLIELNEKRKMQRQMFYRPSYNEIESKADRFRARAKEQQLLMAA
jgi:hypothetical protein